jgi:hypothetical protein
LSAHIVPAGARSTPHTSLSHVRLLQVVSVPGQSSADSQLVSSPSSSKSSVYTEQVMSPAPHAATRLRRNMPTGRAYHTRFASVAVGRPME